MIRFFLLVAIMYYATVYTGWAKKVSYCILSISSLNIDQFSQFFTNGLCKKFATQWHTLIISLHYLVKYTVSKKISPTFLTVTLKPIIRF